MGEFLAAIIPLFTCGFILLFVVFGSAIKIVKEYERGVVLRFGRVQKPLGPGWNLVYPFIDQLIRVDMRTITLDVPSQEAISRDNVTVKVNAVVYFRVIDPIAAIIQVEDYHRATWQIAQTSLRNVIGQSSLDQLLQDREKVNEQLQHIIDEATEPWGIKVSIVEVKDVELNSQMIRAMAREAEAERERRAKQIHADGELQASERLAQAAKMMGSQPGAMTLRYLQTLIEIGVENNTTTIFPIPIDLFSAFVDQITGNKIPDSDDMP